MLYSLFFHIIKSRYDEPVDIYDNDARAARDYFRGGRYENFEIRYTRGEREDMPRVSCI